MTPNEEQALRTMLGYQQDLWPTVQKKYNAVKYRIDKVSAVPLSLETLAVIVGSVTECPDGEEPTPSTYDDSMDAHRQCIVMQDGQECEGWYLGWHGKDQHRVKFAGDEKSYRLIKADDFVTPLAELK